MRTTYKQIILFRNEQDPNNVYKTVENQYNLNELKEKVNKSQTKSAGDEEIWQRDPQRTRNRLEVSNLGKIRDFNTKEILEIIESPILGKGWLVLKRFPSVLVYHLVAEAWLKYPEDGTGWQIHHIDNDGNNNSPENLIFVSSEEHYEIHHGLLNNQ